MYFPHRIAQVDSANRKGIDELKCGITGKLAGSKARQADSWRPSKTGIYFKDLLIMPRLHPNNGQSIAIESAYKFVYDIPGNPELRAGYKEYRTQRLKSF